MKKNIKSIVSKLSLTAFVLVIMQTLSFAAEKTPDVYVSRASVSDLSGPELLNTSWVWMLIGYLVILFAIAYFATRTVKKTGEPHAL